MKDLHDYEVTNGSIYKVFRLCDAVLSSMATEYSLKVDYFYDAMSVAVRLQDMDVDDVLYLYCTAHVFYDFKTLAKVHTHIENTGADNFIVLGVRKVSDFDYDAWVL